MVHLGINGNQRVQIGIGHNILLIMIEQLDHRTDGVACRIRPHVAVPRTAIVEEMGSYFVFVQNSPISFEKRSVELGATDGHLVKVNKGVHKGERIVTKGAVVLKLSQGAAALDPHAGHVH